MTQHRRLVTDVDFQEAMDQQSGIRVFQNDLVVDSGGVIVRYTDSLIVIQSGVSEVAYHERKTCEFFELKKR